MFHTVYSQIGIALLLGTLAFALWKGGFAERVGACLNVGNGIVTMALHPLLAPDVAAVATLAFDAVAAVGFLFLAMRYASLWLGVAMLLQAVQFSLHAYYLVNSMPPDLNHARINNFDTTGINLVIILGTIVAWRRRLREKRADDAARQVASA
jgi:4-amino-4-deoxy-L-arabinose transferase-like glycosyltransferase